MSLALSARPGAVGGPRTAEADHLVSADVGLWLRRRLRPACRAARPLAIW